MVLSHFQRTLPFGVSVQDDSGGNDQNSASGSPGAEEPTLTGDGSPNSVPRGQGDANGVSSNGTDLLVSLGSSENTPRTDDSKSDLVPTPEYPGSPSDGSDASGDCPAGDTGSPGCPSPAPPPAPRTVPLTDPDESSTSCTQADGELIYPDSGSTLAPQSQGDNSWPSVVSRIVGGTQSYANRKKRNIQTRGIEKFDSYRKSLHKLLDANPEFNCDRHHQLWNRDRSRSSAPGLQIQFPADSRIVNLRMTCSD